MRRQRYADATRKGRIDEVDMSLAQNSTYHSEWTWNKPLIQTDWNDEEGTRTELVDIDIDIERAIVL